MLEAWKPVVGYEDYYEVSNTGRVRSLDRIAEDRRWGRTYRKQGKELTGSLSGPGTQYLKVTLSVGGVNKIMAVHRLVAFHFLPHVPGKNLVLHTDGNPLNNRADNLRWGTLQENMEDMIRAGNRVSHKKMLTPDITRYIQSSKKTLRELAAELSIHPTTVSTHRHKPV